MRPLNITVLTVAFTMLHLGFVESVHANKGWPKRVADCQLFSSPLIANLDSDPFMEIIVCRTDNILNVYDHDGQSFSGWPSTAPDLISGSVGTMSSPAVGDVDGDGALEIVIAKNESDFTDASIVIFELNGTRTKIALDNNGSATGKATPVLIDCIQDSNSALEILLRDGDGQLHIIRYTGSGYEDLFNNQNDWRTVNSTSYSLMDRAGRQSVTPSVSAVKISATKTYIVSPSTDGKVYHWELDSDTLNGYDLDPLTPMDPNPTEGATSFVGSAALADLNDDGEFEVIVGATNGNMYIWDDPRNSATPSLLTDPMSTDEAISGSPAVADIDDDGDLEIIVGSEDSKVYAWHVNGSSVSGWPVETRGDILASVVVANLDQTNQLEVIVVSAGRELHVFNDNGSIWKESSEDGWPKRLPSLIYASPAVGDIHNSGKPSIILGDYDGTLFCFDLPDFIGATGTDWPQFRGGIHRTGMAE
jgi:VCBS repeat protein